MTTATPTATKPLTFLQKFFASFAPATDETRVQAIARLKAARSAERDALIRERDSLTAKLGPDGALAALGGATPRPEALADAQRLAEVTGQIAALTHGLVGLDAAVPVAAHQDGADRADALLAEYRVALAGFETAMVRAKAAYLPALRLADQLEGLLGSMIITSTQAGPDARAFLREPMDTSRCALANEWRSVLVGDGPNPSKLERWQQNLETFRASGPKK